MNRSPVRVLLTSAALAAAIGLAGCNPDDIPTTGRAMAPLSEKMVAQIADKRMDKDSPILVRIFKEEAELEVWKKNQDGQFALLKTYPICRWSGDLGPKKKEGDRQAPEGFYTITPGQMNPNSNYYLAFNTGYPNTYDRAWGRTGSELMVHGDCSSRGCYAMTDEQIQEIYALARDAFFGGQKEFQFEAFPFRMTALNMAKHRNNPNFAFWKMLKEGYDDFEATRQEPKVNVCEKRYVFDAAPPENASRPLAFNSRGKCPAYRLNPAVADVVLDHRRHEQVQMAEYIASGVSTVPIEHGVDGGMNPVFAAKLASHIEFDNNGRTFEVAGNSQAPGALPRTPNAPPTNPNVSPAVQSAQLQQVDRPIVMASVPMPKAAPLPKEGEAPPEQKPTTITGLLGNLFGGSNTESKSVVTASESEPADLRQGNADVVEKTRSVKPVRTATAAPVTLHPKPERPEHKPKAVANIAPAKEPAPKPKAVASTSSWPTSPWPAAPKPAAPAAAASSPWPAAPAPVVASAPVHHTAPKAIAAAPEKPKAVASHAAKPHPRVAARSEKPERPLHRQPAPTYEMRTAYAPPASNGGLLAGAQPVVPAGSFATR
ncbi:MAG TPA: L,D-transpeptidase family protein [Pseudolabrys sp.]|nr:L,D-transpeptidase family protein [Pseudolabrys sp.]